MDKLAQLKKIKLLYHALMSYNAKCGKAFLLCNIYSLDGYVFICGISISFCGLSLYYPIIFWRVGISFPGTLDKIKPIKNSQGNVNFIPNTHGTVNT